MMCDTRAVFEEEELPFIKLEDIMSRKKGKITTKINTKNAEPYMIKSRFMEINTQINELSKKKVDFDGCYGTHSNPYRKEIEQIGRGEDDNDTKS